jgi:hypothetical protein
MYQIAARKSYFGLLVLIGFALFNVPSAARPAKDIIRFKNGDKWTCEIKKLDHGYLSVGLDYVDGTVNLDWSKIESVESSQLFVVTDTDGIVHVGTISTSSGQAEQIGSLSVNSSRSRATILSSRIAMIQQTGSTFWRDFHGGVSSGFNFSKSNSQTQ